MQRWTRRKDVQVCEGEGCTAQRGRGRGSSYAGSPSRAAALASRCHLRRRLARYIPSSIRRLIIVSTFSPTKTVSISVISRQKRIILHSSRKVSHCKNIFVTKSKYRRLYTRLWQWQHWFVCFDFDVIVALRNFSFFSFK